jgi:hypothetical protein
MPLKSSHRSGSALTLCLVFVLSIVFLAPLYHSHDHAADHHPAVSDDHVSLHDGAGHEGLSVDQLDNGSHLHIKKDIGRTDDHLRFTSRSLKPDLCAATEFLILTGHSSCTFEKRALTFIFRSNTYDCLSGLSPPVA